MKRLPASFRKNGFDYEMLTRSGNVAIFKQSHPDISMPTFEVVVIGEGRSWEAFGQKFPASEIYPSSNQWGLKAWTCSDLESAIRKFEAMAGRPIAVLNDSLRRHFDRLGVSGQRASIQDAP